MGNKSDIKRDAFMLKGALAKNGYDWWWHSFTGEDAETGEEKSFFIEFFTCNPALGGDEPVFGQLPENKANHVKPSYLMIKAGVWGENAVQLHRFFGWNNVKVAGGVPFEIAAGDCFLSETASRGSISISEEEASKHTEWMCGSGSMSWDISISKKVSFNVGYGASTPMRNLNAFEMFWHAEGIKTEFSGTVEFSGRKYIIKPETCCGYADKNWGRGFTSPWVWLSSCNLVSKKTGRKLENSVFDIGGGRPKVGPIALNRKLLSLYYYEGKNYEFNFSKLHEFVSTEFTFTEKENTVEWHVRQTRIGYVMDVKISCDKNKMLFVNYEAPDGSKRHNRLWNGGNGHGTIALYRKTKNGNELIDEAEAFNVGCEYGEYC